MSDDRTSERVLIATEYRIEYSCQSARQLAVEAALRCAYGGSARGCGVNGFYETRCDGQPRLIDRQYLSDSERVALLAIRRTVMFQPHADAIDSILSRLGVTSERFIAFSQVPVRTMRRRGGSGGW